MGGLVDDDTLFQDDDRNNTSQQALVGVWGAECRSAVKLPRQIDTLYDGTPRSALLLLGAHSIISRVLLLLPCIVPHLSCPSIFCTG